MGWSALLRTREFQTEHTVVSAIAQAVHGLLAGLLLPTGRGLWIHGLLTMDVKGLVPVWRLPADCAADRSRSANPKRWTNAGWPCAGFRRMEEAGTCAAIEVGPK